MSFLDIVSGILASVTSSFFNNSTLGTISSNVTRAYGTFVSCVTTFFNNTVVNTPAVTGSSTLNNTLTTNGNNTIDDVLGSTNHSVINTNDSNNNWNMFMYCLVAVSFVCVMRHICYHFMRGFQEEKHSDLMMRRFFGKAGIQNNNIDYDSRERPICCNVEKNIVRQRNDINTEGDEDLSVDQCREEQHSVCSRVIADVNQCEKGSSNDIDCEGIALTTMSTNVVVEVEVTEQSTFL